MGRIDYEFSEALHTALELEYALTSMPRTASLATTSSPERFSPDVVSRYSKALAAVLPHADWSAVDDGSIPPGGFLAMIVGVWLVRLGVLLPALRKDLRQGVVTSQKPLVLTNLAASLACAKDHLWRSVFCNPSFPALLDGSGSVLRWAHASGTAQGFVSLRELIGRVGARSALEAVRECPELTLARGTVDRCTLLHNPDLLLVVLDAADAPRADDDPETPWLAPRKVRGREIKTPSNEAAALSLLLQKAEPDVVAQVCERLARPELLRHVMTLPKLVRLVSCSAEHTRPEWAPLRRAVLETLAMPLAFCRREPKCPLSLLDDQLMTHVFRLVFGRRDERAPPP